jgi:hypothetical protein
MLFRLTNAVAVAGWAVLLLGTHRVVPMVRSGAVGLLCLAYALLLGALLGGLVDPVRAPGPPPDVLDYSVRGLRRLFQSDGGIVVGWTHYLALDLFAGCWIAERAAGRGWGRGRRAPVLVLTFLAGPAGVLAWLVLGEARSRAQ